MTEGEAHEEPHSRDVVRHVLHARVQFLGSLGSVLLPLALTIVTCFRALCRSSLSHVRRTSRSRCPPWHRDGSWRLFSHETSSSPRLDDASGPPRPSDDVDALDRPTIRRRGPRAYSPGVTAVRSAAGVCAPRLEPRRGRSVKKEKRKKGWFLREKTWSQIALHRDWRERRTARHKYRLGC